MNRLHSTTSRNNNNEIREFKHEDVDYLEEIGNGYYGEVWLVRVHDQVSGTRRVHAAKKIRSGHLIVTEDPEAISELKALKNELEIYKQIQGHPNFPQLIGVVRDDRNCCIILEYVECGDLCSFLQQKAEMGMVVYQPVGDDDFDENTIFNRQEKQMRWKQKIGPEPADGTMTTSILVYIALQAALALKFLVVNLKILHRDTAARNVLIKDDYVIKITDFGLARNANYTGESSVAFPFATWALELLKTPSMFTEKTEVWQYGVLLCEIFSMGKKPYEKLLAAAKAAAAESGKNFSPKTAIEEFLERGGRLEAPQIMPNPIKRIMARCFLKVPDERPSFEDIIKLLHDLLSFMSPELTEKIDQLNRSIDVGATIERPRESRYVNVMERNCPVGRPGLQNSSNFSPAASKSNLPTNVSVRIYCADVVQFVRKPEEETTLLQDGLQASKRSTLEPLSQNKFQYFCIKSVYSYPRISISLLIFLICALLSIGLLTYQHSSRKNPTDCLDIHIADRSLKSGVYKIYTDDSKPHNVFCDMENAGGGWTVFQRRSNSSILNFHNQLWNQYKNGFGIDDSMTNFWLGLDLIHWLSTKDAKVALRIDLHGIQCEVDRKHVGHQRKICVKTSAQNWTGVWNQFRIDNEALKYKIHIGLPGGDSLNSDAAHDDSLIKTANNQSFTTYDRDNDGMSKANCARMRQQGAWWYRDCACDDDKYCTPDERKREILDVALNGIFDTNRGEFKGIIWEGDEKQKNSEKYYRIIPDYTVMELRRIEIS